MPRFRPKTVADSHPLTPDVVRDICTQAARLSNFFVATPHTLTLEHRSDEESFWEVFAGRLLDGSQTRERRRFEAWNVYVSDDGGQPAEPVVAIKFNAGAGEIH